MKWLDRLRGHTGRERDSKTRLMSGTRPVSVTATTEAVALGERGSTLVRPALGYLTVVEGPPRLLSRRFALRDDEVSIGRTETCYVSIPDTRVSRLHARVVREGDGLVLVHCSQTNQTALNGTPLQGRAPLHDGDESQLADRVVLRLEAPGLRHDPAGKTRGLREVMEERVALEDHIAQAFVRDGSFLDVDVVESFRLKAAEERPERVVVSFERFRALIEGVVEVHGGQVLNSNGDEVMAFFASADAALAGGRAILAGLPEWNRRENRLANDFQVRIGIHTGRSPVDLERGVAYSPVLDGAGHLQKAAPVGGLLLSKATYDALGERRGLAPRGVLTKDGIEGYGEEEGSR